MDLIELTPDYEVTEFDCGDEQLNKFLFEDAKPSLALRVATTIPWPRPFPSSVRRPEFA